MTEPQRHTHVVLDTDVTSWLLAAPDSSHAEAALRVIGRRTRLLSFVTATELRFGALRAGWGELRLRRMERSLDGVELVQTSKRLINRCAELRAWANRTGHPFVQKIHEADRWVAATALALDLELVAGDGIYAGVEGLDVHRIHPS